MSEKIDDGYKVWHCRYRKSGSYGFYDDKDLVVIAETLGVALSLAAHDYPDSDVTCWTAEEIPTNKHYVHYVSSSTS